MAFRTPLVLVALVLAALAIPPSGASSWADPLGDMRFDDEAGPRNDCIATNGDITRHSAIPYESTGKLRVAVNLIDIHGEIRCGRTIIPAWTHQAVDVPAPSGTFEFRLLAQPTDASWLGGGSFRYSYSVKLLTPDGERLWVREVDSYVSTTVPGFTGYGWAIPLTGDLIRSGEGVVGTYDLRGIDAFEAFATMRLEGVGIVGVDTADTTIPSVD